MNLPSSLALASGHAADFSSAFGKYVRLLFGNAITAWLARPRFRSLLLDSLSVSCPRRASGDAQSAFISPILRHRVVVGIARQQTSQDESGQPLGIAVDSQSDLRGWRANGSSERARRELEFLGQLGQARVNANCLATLRPGPTAPDHRVRLGRFAHSVKAIATARASGSMGVSVWARPFDFPPGSGLAGRHTVCGGSEQRRVQVLDLDGNFLRWFSLQPDPSRSATPVARRHHGDSQDAFTCGHFQGQSRCRHFRRFVGRLGGYGEKSVCRSPRCCDGSAGYCGSRTRTTHAWMFLFRAATLNPATRRLRKVRR